jgi:hypothetical protein
VLSEEAALRAGADFLRSLGLLGGNARLALMPALIEVR